MNEYKGALDASDKRFAIVAARFNEAFVRNLIDGAVDCLERLGAGEDAVDLYWVPGAFELPMAVRGVAMTGQYDAIIPLGVVIRGATSHYDVVVNESTKGIADASRQTGVPVVLGIVTVDTQEQATERCGSKMGNKGWDAAMSAVEMANLSDAFDAGEQPGGSADRGRSKKAPRG